MLAPLSCLEFLFILRFFFFLITNTAAGKKCAHSSVSIFQAIYKTGVVGQDMSMLIAFNWQCQTALLKSFNHICCNQQEILVLQHLTL